MVMDLYSIPIPEKYEISGTIRDNNSGEGLPFATIQILTKKDTNLITGTLTDANGKYLIKDIQSGEYILMASYMGYTNCKKTLNIQSKKVKCDFSLVLKSISLSEISITAEKNLVEKNIEKTTVNVSKNMTVTGGNATDVMRTLPSVDIDIDGNINYRGSDKVIILINGEKSELVKSLDQIPASQIEKMEIINNPSAKYEAEGMSGIINIVLKAGKAGKDKTTLVISAGYPETVGGNASYSKMTGKTRFFISGGMKHNTKFQIKEHLRENYENINAYNYFQHDRQDEVLNDALINSNLEYSISKKQRIGISLIGSKKFNNAARQINYETLNKSGQTENESLKDLDIDLDNYTIGGNLNYKYSLINGGILSSKIHHSYFDLGQKMSNQYYPEVSSINPELQNTISKQINKQTDFSLDYLHPFNDSIQFETGYYFDAKDLMNDFNSESFRTSGEWVSDSALASKFNYKQLIQTVYFNLNAKLKYFELQAGLRGEFTTNLQDNTPTDEYFDIFPSVNISRKLNKHFSVFAGYNRRINRPTIKMLNPFSFEYADLLNMHKGNPDLKPEYVNSIEIGNRFVSNKFSGMSSIYYRNLDQAISRIKSASDNSALFVSYLNLDKAKLIGGEISLTYKPFKWWNINSSSNIFYTNLSGEYGNNLVNNSKTGWTMNMANNFKLPNDFGFQVSGYFRSKLPSVTGTYTERHYVDLALNKKILKTKAQLIFKISDVFNIYKFGLNLDAIDDNDFRYSQKNTRKNESQYFVLSFIYNINGKENQKKKQKENFFLDEFDK
jgi:outer membrane receptor protein involved in Fe transport